MGFFNEPAWEVYAWISTALITWGICLLFWVRCATFNICKPTWWVPSAVWFFVDLAMLVLYAVAAYMVWNIGGWAAHPWQLALYLGTLFFIVVACFVMYFIGSIGQKDGNVERGPNSNRARPAVIVAGVFFLVAAACAVAVLIGYFLIPHYWSGALATVMAAWLIFRGIVAFILAGYLKNTFEKRSCGPCKIEEPKEPAGQCTGTAPPATMDDPTKNNFLAFDLDFDASAAPRAARRR